MKVVVTDSDSSIANRSETWVLKDDHQMDVPFHGRSYTLKNLHCTMNGEHLPSFAKK